MTDSALHNRLLKRYWFRTSERLGFGVTAFSVEDARALVEQRARELRWDYEVVDIIENVDVRDLDQRHVVPNMGPPNLRGVWFPWQGIP